MKRKGFTLIELLAVIVVLAIIALIAVPVILGVVDKAGKSAFRDSVMNSFSALDYKLIEDKLSTIPDGGIDVTDLKLKSNFKSGKYIKKDGKIIAEYITDGTYCAYGEINNLIIIKGRCSELDTVAPITDSNRASLTPTYSVKPDGYTTGEKTVTITYPNGYTNEYSIDGGITWQLYTGPVTFASNSSIIARVSDGKSYVMGSSQTVSGIDKTGPTASVVLLSKTIDSISLKATCSDAESGITNIEFSKDNGLTWAANGTTADYTFNGLSNGTYNIKVRCTNEVEITTISNILPVSIIAKLSAGLTKGTVVYMNPENNAVCTQADYNNNTTASNTGNKIGCMKWYVYKDNGNETYQLILDHNTTAAVRWSSTNLNNTNADAVKAKLISDTSGWNSSLNARLMTADEVAQITGNTTFSGATSTGDKNFYFDTNASTSSTTCRSGNITGCKYGWLYDRTYTNCTTYGCLNNANVSTLGYWVDTRVSGGTDNAWLIFRFGMLTYTVVSSGDSYGVRPVVTF